MSDGAVGGGSPGHKRRWPTPSIQLRPGITLAFLIVIVPLNAGMIAFNYRQNVRLAFEMADAAMQRTTLEVTEKVDALLAPVGQAVSSLVALAELDRHGLRHDDSQDKVFKTLQRLPNTTSLYAGFASDGAFYQVIRLRAGLERLGPDLGPLPPEARFALRALEARDGPMVDRYRYLDAAGQGLGTERGPVRYDPRQRRWYQTAMLRDGLTISDVYAFSGTGALGLTVSERITDGAGAAVGVVGADISLQSLARFLDQRRIGGRGVVFILDEDGRLIGHPRAGLTVSGSGEQTAIVRAEDAADRVVADAVRRRAGGGGDQFRGRLGEQDEEFLVAFHPCQSSFGRAWVVGIAAPVEAFVGPIQRASLIFLGFGVLVIGIAVVVAVLLSRLISRPIQALTRESDRIRHFDLAERPVVRSGIVDVDTLAASVDRMKSGLRSFGAYVPKELVRHIIASGDGTEVGGTRRLLTVLFADIRNFSSISEALSPEDVLERLSQYFDVMSHAIHETGGAVDKFIGDAIMAMWNAPSPDPGHALSACRAVLACIEAERTLNKAFLAAGHQPFRTRFGLHTGTAVVGNVGSRDRMQYTALGAMVNLASRVESLNKRYGTGCLITGPVEAAARGHLLVRMVDIVIPVGTSVATPLFELVGPAVGAPAADIARCALWTLAFERYRARDWPQAIEAFGDYLAHHEGDPAAVMLLDRCRLYRESPPPADWDGANRFVSK
ncbi:MAG: adenylate/guanylate cyclase domain-containing protein [Rhodospirillaceae bacterium]